ncbi:MAG: hypothetical protein EOP90_09560 [Lysobacteraceae bacterium]|nr:MAG: hypothetical protein EOP90_09560 [Xanthomonadaceae bacterium]
MKSLLSLLLLVAAVDFTSATPAASSAASGCAALFRERVAADLDLPYDTFDQTEGHGFRILAAAGCPAEAADLIEAWIAKNKTTRRSLDWHIAQMRAEAGATEAAIAAARRSLISADEARTNAFKWNDYVLAVIAFLQRDRAAFDRHRDVLAAAADAHAGNAMNLRFIDRLEAGFGGSYAAALAAQ